MIRVSGDLLTAFVAELDMTQEEFDALPEEDQNKLIAENQGFTGVGKDKQIVVDFVEEM